MAIKQFISSMPVVVVRTLVRRYVAHRVAGAAAELAYCLLFALFPFLLFLNATVGLFNLSPAQILNKIDAVIPDQIVSIITEYLNHISVTRKETMLIVGFVLTAYALSRSVNTLMRAAGRAYRIEKGDRFHFLRVIGISVLLLIAVYVLLTLLVGSEALLRWISGVFNLPDGFVVFWGFLRGSIAPVFLFLLVSAFYHIVSRGRQRFVYTLPGAFFSLLIGAAASVAFTYYVSNLTNYSYVYGSIGAVMVLMLWLYIIGMVLILGAELNDVLHQEIVKKYGMGDQP